MPGNYLMGIDIGTSGCKLTIFNLDGEVISTYLGEYETYYPAANYVEHDPRDWWKKVCQGIKYFKNEQSINMNEIAGIGVDGLSWAALPVDRKGIPLRNVMIWLDRRAEKQAEWMREKIGEQRLFQVNGNPVDPAYIVPKMLWIKENEPEIYNNTFKFLQSNSYIVYKLTGKFSQDYSQGYGFHFFNTKKGCWNQEISSELGIELDQVAPLFKCHEVVGAVSEEAAEETGLVSGTPVVAGGLDAACCTLGAGVIKPGQTQEQGGQAGGMSIQLGSPKFHRDLIFGYHVIPDQWLLQGGTTGGGGTLRWFKEQLGIYENQLAEKKDISSYQVMDKEAEEVKPGSDGLVFLPYMAGERSPIWNSKARGVFFGLSYDKTRAHLIRSMMEGVGFSLLHNLKTAEKAGAVVSELNSVGGAANSELWTQIKADITGKQFNIPASDHATTLGAAILAGVGAGIYKDFSEAVNRTVKIERTHKPDRENHKLYQKYYNLYLELYDNLEGSYENLDEIRTGVK
ncbi:MAG: xylulokinase [Halanaerobiaceae bacterium]